MSQASVNNAQIEVQRFTLDLSTEKLFSRPFEISSPFACMYIESSTDAAYIKVKFDTNDSFQNYVTLGQKDIISFPYQKKKCFIAWDALASGSCTVVFLSTGKASFFFDDYDLVHKHFNEKIYGIKSFYNQMNLFSNAYDQEDNNALYLANTWSSPNDVISILAEIENIQSGDNARFMSFRLSGEEYFGVDKNAKLFIKSEITDTGITGDITINQPSGTVNFATGATTLRLTNSLITRDSIVLCVLRTGDVTACIKNTSVSSGVVRINLLTPATNETSCGFLVIN